MLHSSQSGTKVSKSGVVWLWQKDLDCNWYQRRKAGGVGKLFWVGRFTITLKMPFLLKWIPILYITEKTNAVSIKGKLLSYFYSCC